MATFRFLLIVYTLEWLFGDLFFLMSHKSSCFCSLLMLVTTSKWRKWRKRNQTFKAITKHKTTKWSHRRARIHTLSTNTVRHFNGSERESQRKGNTCLCAYCVLVCFTQMKLSDQIVQYKNVNKFPSFFLSVPAFISHHAWPMLDCPIYDPRKMGLIGFIFLMISEAQHVQKPPIKNFLVLVAVFNCKFDHASATIRNNSTDHIPFLQCIWLFVLRPVSRFNIADNSCMRALCT